jgi:hypothetical protein
MSLWIAGISLAAGAAAKTAQGIGAMGVDTGAAVDAAGDLAIAEKQQNAKEQKLAVQKIDFKAKSLGDAATTKGRESLFNIFKFKEAASVNDFESADATNVAIKQSKTKSYSEYSTNIDNIMEESELSKEGVSLSTLRENADIEKRLQSNITAATSVADTFLEGIVGQGDYEVG